MKKVFVLSILVLFVGSLFALESDPSAVVGFVKYSCITTTGTNLNKVALPMDAGYAMASDLGNANPGIDAVYTWNATTQAWDAATDLGFMWLGDFALNDGFAYLVNTTAVIDVYIAGGMIVQPTYSLITTTGTNLNYLMVPLDRTDLTMASHLGIDIGVCDAVYSWNSGTQAWDAATDLGFMWLGDFAISIADPLMVNVTADVSWPTGDGDNRISKTISKVRK